MPHAPDLSGCALDDRYELHAVIGEGAFGRVYEGRDRRLDRPVAVKVIKPWWTEDPDWVASFEREAQLLARVSDPGIVQIFDVGHAPEGLYYVSELVAGENLAARLRRGPVAPWEACAIAAQLCRALAHAHAKGIVHRDVKPANILLSTQGRVKVGDFGVARLAEGSTDGGATIVGTPRYMAPEQGTGRPTTPATDMYSVGVVLYEMLAGTPPFASGTVVEMAMRHLHEPPPPLPARLPATLQAITARALAKEPDERFADGAEMADALLEARRRAGSRQRPAAVPARSRPAAHAPRRRALAASVSGPGGSGGAGGAILATVTATAVPSTPPAVRAPRRGGPAGPPRRDLHDTRPQPPSSPRRRFNPPARRRAAAVLALVLGVLGAMVVGSVVLARPARTRVPRLTGLTPAAARARARHGHLRVTATAHRHSTAPAGTVIGQRPRAGAAVRDGTGVRLTVSSGRLPVSLPLVEKEDAADARARLRTLGLATTVTPVAAPGMTAGTVVDQTPGPGAAVRYGSTVALTVAETPRWRPVTTFVGRASGPFTIRGSRWRITYGMAFQGTCTWIVFCSGPSARIADLGAGAPVPGFGLSDGSPQTRTITSGPGRYEVQVTPGGDDARWTVTVEDWY